jgi:hypothetical protein
MTKIEGAAAALVVLGIGVMTRTLFPRTVTVATPPRIVTVYDTVAQLDTAWVPRLVHDTIRTPAPPPEKITTTIRDTIYRVPPLAGLTSLDVAAAVGDSTLAAGFSVTPVDSGRGYDLRRWTAQYYTLGPVRSIVLQPGMGAPRLTWGDPPPPPCALGCTLRHYATGAAVGGGIVALLFSLFAHH